MQTFLPICPASRTQSDVWDAFRESAAVLDRRRLGKQRVENLQLLNALTGNSSGWANHPAARMWRGYEMQLFMYQVMICNHWTGHWGYRDTCLEKSAAILQDGWWAPRPYPTPDWIGDPAFHAAHRSQLLAKDPDHYGQQGWTESPGALPYIWPEERKQS